MSHWSVFVIAFIGTLASARVTRLIVDDDFPPIVYGRTVWDRLTRDGSWSKLAHCGWCLAPYVVAVVFGVGYLTDWPTWWYVFCSWMTASYIASWIVFHDED